MSTHILLIKCSDRTGLIHAITGALLKHHLNIVSNSEFVEKNPGQFFMRTEFSGTFDSAGLLKDLDASLPSGVEIKLSDRQKKDIIILVTKEHHCLSDLLVRHAFNELHANIRCVISNYDLLEQLSKKFDIPFYHISHESKTREQHEQDIMEIVDRYSPAFLVLAKYMRILSPDFIARFPNRIINIHHSFLPAFIGANPYGQAYARGVKIIGATAHFVNEHLDEGPIIAQNVIHVNHTHNSREMTQAGREVEKAVLAHSLSLVLNERVFVHGNKTIIFD